MPPQAPPPRDSRDLLERAAAAPGDAAAARRALPLLDLTSLNDDDTEAGIARLCDRAAAHRVAAVCIHPRFLPLARERLAGSGVRLATVANFPDGGDDLAHAADEVAAAAAEGADEVDVVIPVRAVLAGDIGLVSELIELCRTAGGAGVALKAILETGALKEPDVIAAAARAAVMAGADFLKTSTGKAAAGATPEAAAVLLAVIDEAGGRVGLKLSGGIRTTKQAAGYLYLADHLLGPDWPAPGTLRFGASSLLDDLLATAAAGR